MFIVDVVALRQFYASLLGRQAARLIGEALHRIWPENSKDRLAGVGFTLPFLESLRGEELPVYLMLAVHGGIYWPPEGRNRTALIHEHELPLAEHSVNRVLTMHVLEHTRYPGKALEEIWRVLVPGGRALLIVPNRTGLWTFAFSTPFGCGQPFSIAQLTKRVRDKGFTVMHCTTAMYVPPFSWRWLMKIASGIETVGRLFFPGLGGVILMEVEKQIYAAIPEPVKSPIKEVLAPMRTPAMT